MSSFAIFGGFMISIYFMCKTFVHFCANYEAEKTIAEDLYTLNHSTVSSGAKSAQIHSSVTSQSRNDMSAWEWFFCCCCDGSRNRRGVWEEAQKKLRAETDLVEMVQVLRMVKFMRELNEDKGKFNDLIRYDKMYRVKVPSEASFELKSNSAILREEATARELSSENAL